MNSGRQMKNIALAVLVGMVIGATLMYMAIHPDAESASPSTSNALAQSSSDSNVSANRSDAKQESTVNNPSSAARQQPSVGNWLAAAPVVANDQRTQIAVAPPPQSATNASYPLSNGNSIARDPIPMTDAHREMLTPTTAGVPNVIFERHTALEQEVRDENWSYYMEQLLSSYLNSRAAQARIEVVNIECRTTGCEIQAFDNSNGPKGPQGLTDILNAATKESWWEFRSMDARASSYQDRIRSIVFLGRQQKKPQSGQQKVASVSEAASK